VGRCRIPDADGVMCPSFQVLREEKHTTRGRARLLFEMLEGDLITDGWRSREVKEALDLCLACKGCTNDCPVNVDIPTYKAEFLSQHWHGRVRPRHAYAFGLIDQVARVASRMPGVVNVVAHTPGLASLVKAAAGMAPAREIPKFAPITLQRWFAQREPRNVGGPKVVLWPDTFNNHFHTDVGVAAVETLEAAGWHVQMPQGHVCCGRPLYDYGFLGLAERYLGGVLDALRDEIRAGVPVVGMEPSCVAVFKDELPKLFPHDDDAGRLRNLASHFPEFLAAHDIGVGNFAGRVLLWGHCHHKATGDMGDERRILEHTGLAVDEATGGCCGLAGSWGFEAGHHELSLAIGEEGLLPAVRGAEPSTVVVADGFSCRTQVEAATGRRPLHLAQVLRLAARQDLAHADGSAIQQVRRRPDDGSGRARIAAVAAGAGACAAALALAARAKSRSR
jgi:Fe-S oxidoreductase